MNDHPAGLDIGLVGVGPWGKHILRDLRTLDARVFAVARSPDSIERATKGGAASIVGHPADLPASCAGFVIANRTTAHLDTIERLLPRGKPIFVEKPLDVNLERARALPAQARDLVFVMHKWRYHPGVIELARIAREKEFGPVEGLRTFRLGWGNPHPDVTSLWILAPHDLSIALAILGEIPELVSAHRDPLYPGADGAIAHLRSRTGIPVVLEVSSGHLTNLRRITLRCRDAVCQLDSANYSAIEIGRLESSEREVRAVSDDMPLLAELRAFIAHVRGGPPPATCLAEELQTIGVISDIERHIGADR